MSSYSKLASPLRARQYILNSPNTEHEEDFTDTGTTRICKRPHGVLHRHCGPIDIKVELWKSVVTEVGPHASENVLC